MLEYDQQPDYDHLEQILRATRPKTVGEAVKSIVPDISIYEQILYNNVRT